MPDFEAVASHIFRVNLPVLFLDTCILLDIIRSTHRRLPRSAENAVGLLKMASSPEPTCILDVSSIVPSEWESNIHKVIDEVEGHLKSLEEHSSHFHEACEALEIPLNFDRARYSGSGMTGKLHELSEQLLNLPGVDRK